MFFLSRSKNYSSQWIAQYLQSTLILGIFLFYYFLLLFVIILPYFFIIHRGIYPQKMVLVLSYIGEGLVEI